MGITEDTRPVFDSERLPGLVETAVLSVAESAAIDDVYVDHIRVSID